MVALKSSSTFANFFNPADRIRTSSTPNQDCKITTLKLDYLNFPAMQRDKQLSCKHFATSALRVNYARERGIVCALQAAHELTREERDYYRLARIWRTSLAQSEVVKGETAGVALPPAAAVKSRVSRLFSEAQELNSNRDSRGEVR